MKLTKTSLSISIFTFFVGFLAAWLIEVMPNSEEVPSSLSTSLNDFQTFTPVEPILAMTPESQPRFTATYIADGFGWWQGYKTNDGQHLVQGSKGFDTPKKART